MSAVLTKGYNKRPKHLKYIFSKIRLNRDIPFAGRVSNLLQCDKLRDIVASTPLPTKKNVCILLSSLLCNNKYCKRAYAEPQIQIWVIPFFIKLTKLQLNRLVIKYVLPNPLLFDILTLYQYLSMFHLVDT